MGISISTRQAYSEIDEFLNLLNIKEQNKIPIKLREFFKEEKDKEYVKKINKNISIKEQNLKEETLAIIALLNLQYWCEDEKEKERLKQVYANNEKKFQEVLKVKFDSDDIFKNRNSNIGEIEKKEQNIQMVQYKESVFKKMINKLLIILHLN